MKIWVDLEDIMLRVGALIHNTADNITVSYLHVN